MGKRYVLLGTTVAAAVLGVFINLQRPRAGNEVAQSAMKIKGGLDRRFLKEV